MQLLVQFAALVQRAHQVQIGCVHGASIELLADHLHQLGPQFRGRQPTQSLRKLHHANPNPELVRIPREVEIPRSCDAVAGNCVERAGRRGRLQLDRGKRCNVLLDSVEEHAYLRHVATEEPMDEVELLTSRQSIVGKPANVLPIGRVRIRIVQSARDDHGVARELTKQPGARVAAADFRCSARLKVAAEESGGSRPSGATDEKP